MFFQILSVCSFILSAIAIARTYRPPRPRRLEIEPAGLCGTKIRIYNGSGTENLVEGIVIAMREEGAQLTKAPTAHAIDNPREAWLLVITSDASKTTRRPIKVTAYKGCELVSTHFLTRGKNPADTFGRQLVMHAGRLVAEEEFRAKRLDLAAANRRSLAEIE